MDTGQETIALLSRLRRGDRAAYDELFPRVYEQLRSLARGHLRRERAGHTLQPTALVHEAYVRLFEGQPLDWKDRVHFVAVAARAMRWILVEHARARNRQKRGGQRRERQRLSVGELPAPERTPEVDVIALDLALDRLAAHDPRKARAVELLYFAGLTAEETARALGTTSRTVERDWAYARAWLLRELSTDPAPGGGGSRRGL
jgi:RNA polymerase sigma factor (TIGR02999 family)